ncbi:polysaccharide lyase family 8 super-sandwich domain-containing protein [Dyadobacter psychrotolerans]|uniref:DNRLRE domain-containing protein n=1 Tax=Dyadobacter psychrotolerans TaxID=2541721 RepID=A0A4R5DK91_9BACT|nr:polysaccharide lyase family 8 super-sandwich domain-containing protein [Dyadobacter psychrotolerans]TDE14439.1 DNRLRE domain-containing protein [Dyadobacter psychrotolerans]
MTIPKRNTFFLLLALIPIFLFTTKANGQGSNDFTIIRDRIFANIQAGSVTSLDAQVTTLLSSLSQNGSWPDIDYSSTSQTDWAPGNHLTRMGILAKAYSNASSTYYGQNNLKTKIETVMFYWLSLSPAPTSTNWFYLSISAPKDIGNTLICLRKAPVGISTELENQMLAWMNKGTAITSSPAKDGSNLTDVAQHYLMRACLTENQSLLNQTITAVTASIVVTTGEGIQNDNSYTAHGPQLYVYGYGREYVSGISNIAVYVAGTEYAFPSDKLAIFSAFVRNGFIKPSRGAYADYNLFGRGVSRANAGKADVALIQKVKGFDLASYATEYDNSIQRMQGVQLPSYNVSAEHIHYWRTDYSIHHRSKYMFGLRSVSSRNAKSEMGNGENIKGYYLTEGANYIAVKGDEYYNIFPVWEWNKIPGTTVPEITTYPVRTAWGVNFGTVQFTGGVSDGTYGASAYAMNDYGTTAKKSWFFFDDEIVCLGAGINSSAAQAINTTVNQCLLKTDVTVADAAGNTSVLSKGLRDYSGNLKWAHQGDVGYFFPNGGNLSLSNQAQTGSWSAINTTGSESAVATDVFKVWFKHGTTPANASYAYIVTPGKTSVSEMQNYDTTSVSILSNTSAVQAVRHNTLGIWQIVFYTAGEFTNGDVTVKANKPCVLMLKNLGQDQVSLHLADPSQSAAQIYIGLKTAQFTEMKGVNFTMPLSAMAGSTVSGSISTGSETYNEPVEPLLKLESVADAFVRSGGTGATAVYGTTNYGTETVLTVKKESAGYDREAFIKFDLSALPTAIDSAVIQLRVNNANTSVTNTKWVYYLADDNTWTETGLTWNSKPAAATKLGERIGTTANSFVKLNITAAVLAKLSADKIISIRVASEPTTTDVAVISKTDASFSSRENTNADYRPQLIVYRHLSPQEGAKKDSILTTADSYARSNTATTNYGTQGYLVARNKTGDVQEIFLKFDLHGLRRTVGNAKLRLYAIESAITTGWQVYKTANNYSSGSEAWAETGINWNNRPASGTQLGSAASQPAAGYVYFDITSALQGIASDSILTLKVTATTDVYSSFRSRNFATDALRPKIIYEYTPSQPSALPVDLISFKAGTENLAVYLTWETASEENNASFEIQRSEDARNFQTIGKVRGNNSTTIISKYNYTDTGVSFTNQLYYRLKQIDLDGTTTVSSVIQVRLQGVEPSITIGPNPTTENLSVFLPGRITEPAVIQIINKAGKTLFENKISDISRVDFDLHEQTPGIYFVRILQGTRQPQIFRFAIAK